jgi:hypothetical protein
VVSKRYVIINSPLSIKIIDILNIFLLVVAEVGYDLAQIYDGGGSRRKEGAKKSLLNAFKWYQTGKLL